MVFHNPFMIHAGTVNEDPDNIIRLATDLRYADSSKPWDSVSRLKTPPFLSRSKWLTR